ncbi:unnamed protein product [Ilex paraguariensis]|uniref:R13L1/DRL21-like LRR repeat region domain-containing protein n=1 Tax=Ilex paraguariensis TaxID=185542 RepID=A0ABC8RJ62_9AQUA
MPSHSTRAVVHHELPETGFSARRFPKSFCTSKLEHFLPDWFENFSSLRSLAISNCERLISLPEGLQRLSTLQHLSIQDCPHLERLCKKKRGSNWLYCGKKQSLPMSSTGMVPPSDSINPSA